MCQKTHRNAGGFTLIELMIVVAIVAILMLVGLPAYQEQQRKARRADAQAGLAGLAIALERYYTEQAPTSTFAGACLVGDTGCTNPVYASQVPLDGPTKHYTLDITVQTATAFTITAAPISASDGGNCGTLTLTNTGLRTVSGSAAWDDCWR